MMCNDLNLNFSISFEDLPSFIEHWAGLYSDNDKPYVNNIEQGLNRGSLKELYLWKSVGPFISKPAFERHLAFLEEHPQSTPICEELEKEILNCEDKKDNAPIFNIFFLHVLSKNQNLNKQPSYVYPIFDQHVRRAMYFLKAKNESFKEWNRNDKEYKLKVYESYKEYKKFYKKIESETHGHINDDRYGRKIDRALFEFGSFIIKNQLTNLISSR